MDLQGIASGIITAVNPMAVGTLRISTGYSTAANGSRTPTYRDVPGVELQVQSLTFRDLTQIDGLNLNGTRKGIYIRGRVEGIVRPENRGGDLIIMPTAQFDGSIAGTVLTVASMQWGELRIGDTVAGAGVAADTRITGYGTGQGGVGTYNLDKSQTVEQAALSTNQTWLVAMVLEQWLSSENPPWCKVAATLQDRS